ncbi:glutathione S-transferase family protein [Alteromonas sp.]|uniref:glutathione S-transferase family protein n=1 Tax=Gammaproteobacteria TaxID=1236 RepID=UPI00257B1EC3|nr:glutathione S-transferase family protein [Alteromonas sp.]|tara:strand:- start:7439 stop:8062 length:624 start_codon:yes stop_codon:yes gene_type:complete
MKTATLKMYKLYDFLPSGNCYKIRLLLNQLGIEYERVNVDLLKKESRTPEFLKINPNGRTPVLYHDGKYLAESNAILWYLAANTHFLPEGNYEQALILQWMFFEQYSHEPNIATPRYWVSILKAGDEYEEQMKVKLKLGYAALDVMEQHLANNRYFVGNQYSIADIALYAYTHVAEEGNFDLSGYRNINKWLKRIEGQENYLSIRVD